MEVNNLNHVCDMVSSMRVISKFTKNEGVFVGDEARVKIPHLADCIRKSQGKPNGLDLEFLLHQIKRLHAISSRKVSLIGREDPQYFDIMLTTKGLIDALEKHTVED